MSKKNRKRLRKTLRNRDFSVNLGIPYRETVAGFPIKKGMKNNLWEWDSLKEVTF